MSRCSAGCCFEHARQHRLDAVVSAREVHVQHLLPQCGIGLGKGGAVRLTRVVDQDIHRPEAGLRLLHRGLHSMLAPHIHGRDEHCHVGHLRTQSLGLRLQLVL
jgi:hypothetical protein